MPARRARRCRRCLTAAANGELNALFRRWRRTRWVTAVLIEAALKNTFVIVQDIFLTETAAIADVVFPAASLYEKTGTVTNTFGDLQLARKAADHAGVKPDFEILVRLAGSMGADVKNTGSFRHGRSDCRSWAVARSAGGRGGSARCLAFGQWPGTKAEPL